MEIYFLLEGSSNERFPVSRSPNKGQADGWLGKDSFAEWNTLQMINFEPQSGRKLVRIYDKENCAKEFGLSGTATTCHELGTEPERTQERDDYALLIPVFESQRSSAQDIYRGGFVRVTADGPVVRPQTNADSPGSGKSGQSFGLGYDLILVVDSTASMGEWFRPTTEVLEKFVNFARAGTGGGEMQAGFQAGLVLYRDRKIQTNCEIEYLTRWEVDLTSDVSSVAQALGSAKEAKCDSDEVAEAVYDGLSRALQDTQWNDGHFKVVLLIGDAPPHSASRAEKNPLRLSVDAITEMSEERNVRFLTFKIGTEDTREFQELAESVNEKVRGRFRAIEPKRESFKQELLAALQEEWKLLTTTVDLHQQGVSGEELREDPQLATRIGIDDYDLPIIISNLPATGGSKAPPEFVEGWVPAKVEKRLAMGEFVFMEKARAQILANVIDTIGLNAKTGVTEGSDAFINSLRSSLSGMLNVEPDELFRSGESLGSMMRKAQILPFKTTVLSFTAEEVNSWTPADYERLNTILSEKIDLLREFTQKASNVRNFGKTAHVYVPRNLFP